MKLALALFLIPSLACAQVGQIAAFTSLAGAPAYTGPGDVVSGASAFWSCSRAYNNSFASSGGVACALRVGTGPNTGNTFNLVVASNGTVNATAASTAAGIDATATCSATSSTTIVCTGASSTPSAYDPITGAGIVNPVYVQSCGTFSAGAGSCTLNSTQNFTSTTVTFHGALYISSATDQTGHAVAITSITANQPLFLPIGPGSIPCMATQFAIPNNPYLINTSGFTVAQPFTMLSISERIDYTTSGSMILDSQTNNAQMGGEAAVNTVRIYAGTVIDATVSDAALHAIHGIFNGSSGTDPSGIAVDGSFTAGNPGTAALGGDISVGGDYTAGSPYSGFICESGVWPVAFSAGQISSMHSNQSAFYGTP